MYSEPPIYARTVGHMHAHGEEKKGASVETLLVLSPKSQLLLLLLHAVTYAQHNSQECTRRLFARVSVAANVE